MAKIILKGINAPIIVDDEQAKQLQDDWLTHKLTDIVRVGDAVFDPKQIKSIELEYKKIKQKENFIDINDTEFRAEVENFERGYLAFLEECTQKVYAETLYFEHLKCIRVEHLETRRITVLNAPLYKKLQRLLSGLQLLRIKRKG